MSELSSTAQAKEVSQGTQLLELPSTGDVITHKAPGDEMCKKFGVSRQEEPLCG